MKTETEKKKISSLLALKTAPKGKIEGDFRVALYAVAALYQLDFGKTSNFGMCSNMLGAVGFKGDSSKFKLEDYFNTLDDLVEKGSLVRIGNRRIYASPNDVKVINAKVKAVENTVLNIMNPGEKHYSYAINDEAGKEYHLLTDYVIMPNDEVEAIITKDNDVAYVNALTKVQIGRAHV